MKRLLASFILGLGLSLSPMVASAETYQDQMISLLTEQGFSDFAVSRTLLGRVRILAYIDGYRREVVINPVTGEILRDYLAEIGPDGELLQTATRYFNTSGSGSGGGTGSGGGSSGGGSSGGDDDGDDEEEEDDDDEEDDGDDD